MTPGETESRVALPLIIDPLVKPPAEWYCVATSIPAWPPWWSLLATRLGNYRRISGVGGADRERLLAAARNEAKKPIGKRDPWMHGLSGWLIVAARGDDSVRLPGASPEVIAGKALFVPMTPKHIPFCGTKDEVLSRVRLLAARDKDFARKWAGWLFLAVRHDDGVMVP